MPKKNKIAILMIHGFLGKPSYDEYLKHYLIASKLEYEIFTYTLLGHENKSKK